MILNENKNNYHRQISLIALQSFMVGWVSKHAPDIRDIRKHS